MSACLLWLFAISCGGEQGPPAQANGGVRALVDELQAHGIACRNLVVRRSQEPDGESGPISDTTPFSPVAYEYGFCQLEGTPMVQGKPLASRLLVFDDRKHLDHLPPREVLVGQALVYGDTWEIYVTPPHWADEIRDALGGKSLRCAPLRKPSPECSLQIPTGGATP